VFEEDDRGDAMYVVVAGALQVIRVFWLLGNVVVRN
jgi:hypothetical protein